MCNNKNRKNIFDKSEQDLVTVLEECVLNTLNGNIQHSKKDRKKLEKHKYNLRKFINCQTSKGKKKILIQKGGFLQYILPGAISIITALIEHFINN